MVAIETALARVVRPISDQEWSGLGGASAFPDGSRPRVVALKVRDELGVHDALLVCCGEAVQIHYVVEVRCPSCAQQTVELRWLDFVPFSYFSHLPDEIAPTPSLAYALAYQIFHAGGRWDELPKSVKFLMSLGFSEVESG